MQTKVRLMSQHLFYLLNATKFDQDCRNQPVLQARVFMERLTMKKVAIAFVAIPLVFMSAGFVTGAMLFPPLSESSLATNANGTDVPPLQEAQNTPDHAAIEGHSETTNMTPRALAEDRTILRLGQMTIPVEKPRSVSYVVADFALKMEGYELAQHYMKVEEATRIRDSLLAAMHLAAEGSLLREVAIDSDALSSLIREILSKEYSGIEDVLFISLYKQDVARF